MRPTTRALRLGRTSASRSIRGSSGGRPESSRQPFARTYRVVDPAGSGAILCRRQRPLHRVEELPRAHHGQARQRHHHSPRPAPAHAASGGSTGFARDRPASTIGSATPARRAPSLADPGGGGTRRRARSRDRRRGTAGRGRAPPTRRSGPATEAPVRSSSPLAVAAANEYAYVARDVRRVAIVGGTLVALLLILWVVTQVTGITL